jgi:hypothetical protein
VFQTVAAEPSQGKWSSRPGLKIVHGDKAEGKAGAKPKPRNGYTRVPNALLDDRWIPGLAKLLLIELYSHYINGSDIFPGRETLAAKLTVSVRTVDNLKSWLADHGHIEWKRAGTGKSRKGRSNRYRIISPLLQELMTDEHEVLVSAATDEHEVRTNKTKPLRRKTELSKPSARRAQAEPGKPSRKPPRGSTSTPLVQNPPPAEQADQLDELSDIASATNQVASATTATTITARLNTGSARRAKPGDWTATAGWLETKPIGEWNAYHLVRDFDVQLHRWCDRTGNRYEELPPHPVNGDALGRNFKLWLAEGKLPDYIRDLIDVFFANQSRFKAEPWKDFLNAKGRLHAKVQRRRGDETNRYDHDIWLPEGLR